MTRKVLDEQGSHSGQEPATTLDLDLQAVAELAMEGKNGAVVAMDPRTGEVLAMVSRPTFDPNKFAVRIKSSDWREIADNPDHPLLNRAIQAQVAPGSTFKPIMALAGLESGTIDDQFTVHCSGGAIFYGQLSQVPVEDTATARLTLHQRHRAILRRVLLYRRRPHGNRQDRLLCASGRAWAQKTGIDLPHEAEGVVPSSEWKIRNFREKWYAGRDDFGGHRARRANGDAGATGARV